MTPVTFASNFHKVKSHWHDANPLSDIASNETLVEVNDDSGDKDAHEGEPYALPGAGVNVIRPLTIEFINEK